MCDVCKPLNLQAHQKSGLNHETTFTTKLPLKRRGDTNETLELYTVWSKSFYSPILLEWSHHQATLVKVAIARKAQKPSIILFAYVTGEIPP